MTFLIAYENSERKAVAYYNASGFPWWSYSKVSPTSYPTEEEAERHAEQLRKQRARSGRIFVTEA